MSIPVRTDPPGTADDTPRGLSSQDAARERDRNGPNVVPSSEPSLFRVVGSQFRNVVLVLLLGSAILAGALGDVQDAVVIVVILAISVFLGAFNEYRSGRAAAAMRDRLTHSATVLRDDAWTSIDVRDLVVGDVIALRLGSVVPADIRLTSVTALAINESVLTGESAPVEKTLGDGEEGAAYQGTVVAAGAATGIVTAVGAGTRFGRIAAGLRTREPETAFQTGLAHFSVLLVWVAAVLVTSIVLTGLLLHRPVLETVLFALAIAVGVTPQLLPAVVSTSLAAGARSLRRAGVLVKRLVCVEDIGNVDVLVTDKTGTLTTGVITFRESLAPDGSTSTKVLQQAASACSVPAPGGGVTVTDALDVELLRAAAALGTPPQQPIDVLPFDHDQMRTTAVVDAADGIRLRVVKGAPEGIMADCVDVPRTAAATLTELLADGGRVLAVATAPTSSTSAFDAASESGLRLTGFLVFADPPRTGIETSIAALRTLGVRMVVVTGDAAEVAVDVARRVGIPASTAIDATRLADVAASELARAVLDAGIVARVRPEQKADLVRSLRAAGHTVGFLGDGVNDALALHAADVGISVMFATDVARDAADVVLLDKDLGVVAAAIATGRRVFANTIKYVMMGTSSNVGNMISATIAACFLPFLPMLPAQVLLNNLVYDVGQLSIPTDRVDEEQTREPSHWDIRAIRRFMLVFGPASSLFDLITFAVLLGAFHAIGPEFRTAWFSESLLTQSLVVLVIRTHRVPFLRSRPGALLTSAALATATVGMLLPYAPFASVLGFVQLPPALIGVILLIGGVYLVLVDTLKGLLLRSVLGERRGPDHHLETHRIRRAAARYAGR